MREDSAEENNDDRSFHEHEFSIFKKFLKMFVTFLKRDHHILDAVGVVFMVGSEIGLGRRILGWYSDFYSLFAEAYTVLRTESGGNTMLASLQRRYPHVERETEQCNGEGRHELDKAKTLLEPIWLYHIFETGKLSMVTE